MAVVKGEIPMLVHRLEVNDVVLKNDAGKEVEAVSVEVFGCDGARVVVAMTRRQANDLASVLVPSWLERLRLRVMVRVERIRAAGRAA